MTFFGAALDVRAGLFAVVKKPVHSSTTSTFSSPHGSSAGLAVGQHADLVAVDDHVLAVDFDGAHAVGGVVAGQVGVGLGIAQVVDGDDFDIVLLATFIDGRAGCCGRWRP